MDKRPCEPPLSSILPFPFTSCQIPIPTSIPHLETSCPGCANMSHSFNSEEDRCLALLPGKLHLHVNRIALERPPIFRLHPEMGRRRREAALLLAIAISRLELDLGLYCLFAWHLPCASRSSQSAILIGHSAALTEITILLQISMP